MTNKKSIRTKGKIQLSQYFKKINKGEKVAVIEEKSIPSSYPKRIIGMSGIVAGDRGACKIVQINDGNLAKSYIIHPIHLKKLK
jgi:large subunit ribosomal protein L21e